MKRVIVIGAAIIGFFATTLFLAPHSEAGLVEDLRSGKSDIKAVSQVGAVIGLVSAWKQAKSFPDFKAIAYSNPCTNPLHNQFMAPIRLKRRSKRRWNIVRKLPAVCASCMPLVMPWSLATHKTNWQM